MKKNNIPIMLSSAAFTIISNGKLAVAKKGISAIGVDKAIDIADSVETATNITCSIIDKFCHFISKHFNCCDVDYDDNTKRIKHKKNKKNKRSSFMESDNRDIIEESEHKESEIIPNPNKDKTKRIKHKKNKKNKRSSFMESDNRDIIEESEHEESEIIPNPNKNKTKRKI